MTMMIKNDDVDDLHKQPFCLANYCFVLPSVNVLTFNFLPFLANIFLKLNIQFSKNTVFHQIA